MMNGSNSLEESEARSAHCCPVDLRKLSKCIPNFNVMERYYQLLDFYKRHNWKEEKDWMERYISFLTDEKSAERMEQKWKRIM